LSAAPCGLVCAARLPAGPPLPMIVGSVPPAALSVTVEWQRSGCLIMSGRMTGRPA
jgi:hypothetical protein